ncbi:MULTISPECIES: DJ-1/PfpI family protein [Pelosinus]|uniref:DJ-1 domain, InhA-type n=1 Tax=Pelosinus fermentans B4 TaxID=1149862 RepID=I8RME5_9FIRM|nr:MULTISPECIES: DJ-1/PfpI family protein [Pelosinus]EIW20005.1 DJ-1 domain, InhA-type [Pelosinus fermentans B4]EIW21514.1 ThiJ/PfpI domain-containing protein [Pelosinus fermentans A11]OAM95085.1 DJ-1 domain, InhA-type [Pelosinus fermentans DSM 17108]SDR23082.1 DJ-1/PfpI family protein [Pelosinus fermentans]
MKKIWRIGIFLFNEVEVLDFAGPFEAFSIVSIPGQSDKPFLVQTVSQYEKMIKTRNGLMVQPHFSFDNAPDFDIVIVPGGYGAEEIEINNEIVIQWIKKQSNKVELITSVCTGAFLLAKAGLIDGKRATTHWMDIDRLEREFPDVKVERNCKFIDEGSIITSGGISAGINMSFHIIKRLLGEDVAKTTAKRMEYDIII